MSVYLDASFLVAFFVSQQPLTQRAADFLDTTMPELIVSDFAAAEFSSAFARLVRTHAITMEQASGVFADFDDWTSRAARRVETTAADVVAATAVVRRPALNLRTPDAINIAIAQRTGAELATFDQRMAASAAVLGLKVAAV